MEDLLKKLDLSRKGLMLGFTNSKYWDSNITLEEVKKMLNSGNEKKEMDAMKLLLAVCLVHCDDFYQYSIHIIINCLKVFFDIRRRSLRNDFRKYIFTTCCMSRSL